MAQPFGSLIIVLHSHIPYVLGHSTWPHGSQMLYEAAADTYLLLLQTFENLAGEGIAARLAIGITPVTMEQLADERFKEWFPGYLSDKCYWADRNAEEFEARGDLHLAYLARRWHDHYSYLSTKFIEHYQRDILAAFRRQQDAANIEVMTSAATHGYLPLLREDGSIQAQIMEGISVYERHMGRRPKGCWLPECAYRPTAKWAPPPEISGTEIPYPRKGVEEFLGENGLDYFIVDAHMLAGGDPLPVWIEETETLGKLWGRIRRIDAPPGTFKTPYHSYFVGRKFEDHPPVAALIRDPETSMKVWSAAHGYPGDYAYLEFHKKHMPGDLRYWAVTDNCNDLATKRQWSPDNAGHRTDEHAGNFLWTVKTTLQAASAASGQPVLVSPFDAELFGHWWHEGLWFLEKAIRWISQDPDIDLATPLQYLADSPPTEAIALPEGSWGAGGKHSVWLNDETAWTWRRIHEAELDMRQLVADLGAGHDSTAAAFIRQAAVELLLMQASDWQFLITTDSAPDYAAARIDGHYTDFKKCVAWTRRYCRGEWIRQAEWAEFGTMTERDHIFGDVNPLWFRDLRRPAY